MAICSEVKRTLVKSPPELWSELSDPESLSRHLEGVGEVRITRAVGETEVDWEAEGASGSVRLEPSGFGTKVTLSLSRAVTEPAVEEGAGAPAAEPPAIAQADAEATWVGEPGSVVEPEAILEAAPVVEPEAAVEPESFVEPEAILEVTPVVEPEVAVESHAEPQPITEREAVSEPRRGFFARLFKRRHKERTVYEQSAETPVAPVVELEQREQPEAVDIEPAPVAVEPEPQVVAESEAVGDKQPEAVVDDRPETAEATTATGAETANVAADLATLEAQMAEQDEAMLIAMLDRLGAAHHRPFSRS